MTAIDKARCIRLHAKARALERFGLALNRADLDALRAAIQAAPPRARFVSCTSRTRTVWEVDLRGARAVTVYDKRRKTIVTVWPAEVTP